GLVGRACDVTPLDSRNGSQRDSDLVCILSAATVSGAGTGRRSRKARAAIAPSGGLRTEKSDRRVTFVSLWSSFLAGSEARDSTTCRLIRSNCPGLAR